MYSAGQLAIKYLKYYFSAANGKGHGMHSPFVFEFIQKVLNDKSHFSSYEKVEALRGRMRADSTLLTIEDMGAGSAVDSSRQRTIASIARSAAKPRKFGQLLHRMVRYYRPQTILELGSSLGITSAYLALGNPGAELITMEGATEVASIARNNLKDLSISNTRLIEGNFDQTLGPLLKEKRQVDFAFMDGNHRQSPTERYFNQLMQVMGNDSMLIVDDIHWSREMEQAWKTIQSDQRVKCTIDLFFIGIVLFRSEFKEKQQFVIKF